jgi:hypothetical protein
MPIGLSAIGASLLSLAAMLGFRMRRGLQQAPTSASSGMHESDTSIALAPASADTILELKARESTIRGREEVLQSSGHTSHRDNFRSRGWWQESHEGSRPFTFCYAKNGGFATATKSKKSKKAKAPKAPQPLEPLPPGLDGVPQVSRFEVLNADGIKPQFAGAFLIEDASIADDLVAEFNNRPQLRGMVSNASNGEPVVDTSVKDSLEMSFPANDPCIAWRRYLLALKAAMGLYLEDYPYAGAYGPFSITGRTNLQLYPPSGGYKTFHTERTGKGEPEGSRHLVFMTYLNDVTDEGGTEFCHQNLIVQPKKGLTLIWPADWTFTHRGVPSPTQEKIITTGWFNFT